ncbi:hypothetical protein [Methyloceanibacter sp.]|uniref:hypothetical protein n=1 Tax=Methyloceanibacter sp. TaxID=1965321 RepID=UPI003C71EE5B
MSTRPRQGGHDQDRTGSLAGGVAVCLGDAARGLAVEIEALAASSSDRRVSTSEIDPDTGDR